MKRIIYTVFALLLTCCIYSCNSADNKAVYLQKTAAFTNSLLSGDYNKCISSMNVGTSKNMNEVMMARVGLDTLRDKLSGHFGNQLTYSVMSIQHEVSDDAYYSLPPNTTLVTVEINNNVNVGALQALFDNHTGKIVNIKSFSVKEPIPNMLIFWLAGLPVLVVLMFNIYALVLVFRSKLKLKLLYYIAIIVVNVPTLEYHAVKGFDIKLYSFQYFLGVYFQKVNYLGSVWDVGLPLGAIFAWWMIKYLPSASVSQENAQSVATKTAAKTAAISKKQDQKK
jgi:hypothetical protein